MIANLFEIKYFQCQVENWQEKKRIIAFDMDFNI